MSCLSVAEVGVALALLFGIDLMDWNYYWRIINNKVNKLIEMYM